MRSGREFPGGNSDDVARDFFSPHSVRFAVDYPAEVRSVWLSFRRSHDLAGVDFPRTFCRFPLCSGWIERRDNRCARSSCAGITISGHVCLNLAELARD